MDEGCMAGIKEQAGKESPDIPVLALHVKQAIPRHTCPFS